MEPKFSKVVSQIWQLFILANIHCFFIIGKDPTTTTRKYEFND